MDKLAAMQVYVSVVETHGFARAAEVLGLPRSTVSRVIRELESWLGILLPANSASRRRACATTTNAKGS